MEWALRPQDPNPLDSFLWSYIESQICNVKIQIRDHLNEHTYANCVALKNSILMLRCVHINLRHCIEKCFVEAVMNSYILFLYVCSLYKYSVIQKQSAKNNLWPKSLSGGYRILKSKEWSDLHSSPVVNVLRIFWWTKQIILDLWKNKCVQNIEKRFTVLWLLFVRCGC